SRRLADQVCGGEPVLIQQRNGVGEQIPPCVTRVPRLVSRRSAGVALVVADHVVAVAREQATEPVPPPKHRPAQTHHEKHWRICRVPERLGAELDTVHVDQALGTYKPRAAPPRLSCGPYPDGRFPTGARKPSRRRTPTRAPARGRTSGP